MLGCRLPPRLGHADRDVALEVARKGDQAAQRRRSCRPACWSCWTGPSNASGFFAENRRPRHACGRRRGPGRSNGGGSRGVLRTARWPEPSMADDRQPAPSALPRRRRRPSSGPDPTCPGRDCGRECRRRPQPVCGARGTTVAGRTARSPGADRPPTMVRPVRRAHSDARLRRRRARPLPALQAPPRRGGGTSANPRTRRPSRPPARTSPSRQPTQPGRPA